MEEIEFRIALLKKGITQNRLAALIGLHPQALSSMVRGYRAIDPDLKKRIAKILGVPEEGIFMQAKDQCEVQRQIAKGNVEEGT